MTRNTMFFLFFCAAAMFATALFMGAEYVYPILAAAIPAAVLYGDSNLPAGTIAQHHPAEHVRSYIAEGAIAFGRMVVRGTAAGQGKLIAGASGTVLGIAKRSTDASNLDADEYADKDPLAVLEHGIIMVEAEEAVNTGDPVRVRHSEDNRAGYQAWGFSAAKTTASATGLANDATAYTASVAVAGVANAVSVVGSAAQTIANLITAINADLTGATAAFVDGAIRITSDTAGAGQDITITDTDLFSSLTDANAAADAAVAGSDDVDATLEPGKFRTSAVAGKSAVVSNAEFVGSLSSAPGVVAVYVKGPMALTADV